MKIPLAKQLSQENIQAIETLAKELRAFGIHLDLPSPLQGGLLTFEYDPLAYKRNAGRKKKSVPATSTLKSESQEQMDDWLLNQPIKTICEELDISRSTAFRRRTEARERLAYAIISLDEYL